MKSICGKNSANMLQKDGYLVEAITEFEDAARLLAALRPDLVILDLNLPEISGFQICQELKNKTAIPVLILTSRDQVKDELQAFHLGADEYLTKPCRKRSTSCQGIQYSQKV